MCFSPVPSSHALVSPLSRHTQHSLVPPIASQSVFNARFYISRNRSPANILISFSPLMLNSEQQTHENWSQNIQDPDKN